MNGKQRSMKQKEELDESLDGGKDESEVKVDKSSRCDDPIQSENFKTCTKCKKSKPLDDYAPSYQKGSRPGAKQANCRECFREYQRQYQVLNRDRRTAQARSRRIRKNGEPKPKPNPNATRKICSKCGVEKPNDSYSLTYRGPDQRRADCKNCQNISKSAWARINRPKRAQQSRERYKADLEQNRRQARKRQKKWRLQRREHYLEKKRQYNRKRRSIINKTLNDLTDNEWEDLKKQFGYRCAYCRRLPRQLTQDHVVPVANNGERTKQNIVPACRSCNSSKGAKSMHEFLSENNA